MVEGTAKRDADKCAYPAGAEWRLQGRQRPQHYLVSSLMRWACQADMVTAHLEHQLAARDCQGLLQVSVRLQQVLTGICLNVRSSRIDARLLMDEEQAAEFA